MIRLRRLVPGILLIITLLITMAMVLLPEISSQTLRLQAFGWDIEVRQGFFILAVLALLWLVYLLQLSLKLLMAGQLRLLAGWRTGRMNRREGHLQTALLQWLDAEGDLGRQALKKAAGVIPDWLGEAGMLLTRARDELPLPLEEVDNPVSTVVVARLVSAPAQRQYYDRNTRRMHLQAWLKQRPQSLLAQFRMAELELEEAHYRQAADHLETLIKKELVLQDVLRQAGDTGDCRQLLATAWLGMMKEDESKRKPLLRKLRHLAVSDGNIMLQIGQLLRQHQGDQAVKKLWLDFLQQHDDVIVADACYSLLSKEAMSHFREIERKQGTASFQWLKARLAHACGLDGLAEELIAPLLQTEPRAAFLRSKAQWLQDKGDCAEACKLLQQALDAR